MLLRQPFVLYWRVQRGDLGSKAVSKEPDRLRSVRAAPHREHTRPFHAMRALRTCSRLLQPVGYPEEAMRYLALLLSACMFTSSSLAAQFCPDKPVVLKSLLGSRPQGLGLINDCGSEIEAAIRKALGDDQIKDFMDQGNVFEMYATRDMDAIDNIFKAFAKNNYVFERNKNINKASSDFVNMIRYEIRPSSYSGYAFYKKGIARNKGDFAFSIIIMDIPRGRIVFVFSNKRDKIEKI
ncbi:hypothetical protein [Deinococcus pimensis]|uniref:hypothetical protein n=1 Tax=Deinococcus pimensis TaxID=309888 RepID=UPI0012FCBA34|nr:hypothetical protein [Deinococcus pimensis]